MTKGRKADKFGSMRPKTQIVTRLDYCQYLLVSQINYTLTNFADHSEKFSHDALNRYLSGERLRPNLTWENVSRQVVQTPKGLIIFDDTVADKNFSHEIELVRRQYSGNAHGVIKGVGVVTCVYVNPELNQFWIIDYRIFDPDGDGKTKLDHVQEMLVSCPLKNTRKSTTVRSKTIAKWTIQVARNLTNEWIP